MGDLLKVTDDDVLKVATYDFVSAEHNTAPRLAGLGAAPQVVVSGAHWVDVLSPHREQGPRGAPGAGGARGHAGPDDGRSGTS